MAFCYLGLGTLGVLPPGEAFPKAREAAEKALAIDEELPDVHIALAESHLFFDWDWEGTEKEFRRALELNPSDSIAYHGYAIYLAAMGRPEDSLTVVKRAFAIDPESKVANQNIGYYLYLTRRYDQAIDHIRKALEVYPDSPLLHSVLADAYERKGKYPQAVEEDLKGFTFSGAAPEAVNAMRRAFDRSGMKGYWREQLKFFRGGPKQESMKAFDLALIYVMLGNNERALQLLEKAYQERSSYLVTRIRDPRLDNLHSEPRFQALLHRMGLPQ